MRRDRVAVRVGAGAAALVAALSCVACSHPAPIPPAVVRSSIDKGLACVASLYDGNSFRDDYLKYEYQGESIDSPLAGYRLTYRILDAYFIVLMNRQAGVSGGGAGRLFDRADAVTEALVPLWRGKGIYNLRHHPAPGGIALDTYAILAVLRRDAAMGRVVEAGLDGDGWLAADFYAGDEAFRRLADESWAVRAVLVADPARGRDLLRALCGQVSAALRSERDAAARANLVIHALEALEDIDRSAAEAAVPEGSSFVDSVDFLRREGLRLLKTDELRNDTLTLSNLAGALIPWGGRGGAAKGSAGTLAPLVEDLIGRQDREGCWSVSLDPGDGSGRVFATLRVILMLARYDAHRLG